MCFKIITISHRYDILVKTGWSISWITTLCKNVILRSWCCWNYISCVSVQCHEIISEMRRSPNEMCYENVCPETNYCYSHSQVRLMIWDDNPTGIMMIYPRKSWEPHFLLSANFLFNDLTMSKRKPSNNSGFRDTEIANTQLSNNLQDWISVTTLFQCQWEKWRCSWYMMNE